MKKLIALFTLTLIVGAVSAQKIAVKEGSMKDIKSIKSWNVVFNYDGWVTDKHGSEAEWIEEKKKEKNDKEAGTGDAWYLEWNESKESLFPQSYCTGMNKSLQKKFGVTCEPGTGDGTIEVLTTWSYMGWRMPTGGVKPAKITTTITFKDADGKVLLVLEVDKAQGAVQGGGSAYSSAGYKASDRLSASYRQTGLAVGKMVAKGAYK
ncbi:hypothetical protein KFE98_13535 [bacterium SCSIO 12741]|nr:hypothetical protein KFE98_13535 [bacterium SCSIO 12741]